MTQRMALMVRFKHTHSPFACCDSTCVRSENKRPHSLRVRDSEMGSKIRAAPSGAVFRPGDPDGNAGIKACVDFTTDLRVGKSSL